MSIKKTDKSIVNIKEKSPQSINQGAILPKVHKIFILGLKPTISDYYEKLDDTLFDMAEKAENNEVQTHYFEAMREVRKKKELMVRKFSENVQSVFKQFKQSKFNYFGDNSQEESNLDSLSLVDEKELEQKLAANNLIDKANTYLHQHLFALEKRFALLAGGSEIEKDQMPISPAVIVSSFTNTFDNLHIDETIYIIMLKLFERSLIQNLVGPYQEINDLLIQEGILPNLKFSVSRQGSQARQAYQSPVENTSNDELVEQLVPVDPTMTNAPVTDSQYHAITQALAQRHNNAQHLSQMPAFDPSIVSNALDVLQVEALNNFNTREITLSPTEIKNALLARLKDLDQDSEQKQVNKDDEDTIDLVGMLFQFLVDDRNLPDRIQALLAKLQIPYLHLALKDRKLFANKENNARKLLDIIAKASIGWNEADDKRGKFINKIESIIQIILETEHDAIDFPELIEDFQDFEAKNNKKSKVIEKRTSEKALGQERILNAKQKTAQILKTKMKNHALPKLISELLLTPWANVLILAHLRHKDEPGIVENYVKLVDKLIFVGVKNKKRAATNAQISHVCDQLSKGLRMVAFDEHSIKEKSQELYQMLLEINGIEETNDATQHEYVKPKEAFETKNDDEKTPEIVHFIAQKKFNSINKEIVHIDDVYFKQAKELETGAWVEFLADENDELAENVRAKLSWVSPISHKLLFVNARGVKVTDKSIDELAHDLREKIATVLQQIPLFDRAMSAIAKQVSDETEKGQEESG